MMWGFLGGVAAVIACIVALGLFFIFLSILAKGFSK